MEYFGTFIALSILFRMFSVIFYKSVIKDTSYQFKGRHFILTKLFGHQDKHLWKACYFSIGYLIIQLLQYKELI